MEAYSTLEIIFGFGIGLLSILASLIIIMRFLSSPLKKQIDDIEKYLNNHLSSQIKRLEDNQIEMRSDIKALDKKIDDNIKALDKKIDDNTKALDKKIDDNTKALDKKIDDNAKALHQKIDDNTKQTNQKFDHINQRLDKIFELLTHLSNK